MALRPSRVLLSGIGGDEVAGGAPAPVPELADLLASVRLRELSHQLKMWALQTRRPWFHLLGETVFPFLTARSAKSGAQPASWLRPAFVKRHACAFYGYQDRWRFFGGLPSFQANVAALDGLRRQLAVKPLPLPPPYESRYPYLDRDLLEFLFAIPRDQLVRPGERRSLMRRALKGIVPQEVLDRRRKAFVARMPRLAIAGRWSTLTVLCSAPAQQVDGIIDHAAFLTALEEARSGREVPLIPLLRTIGLLRWLRNFDQVKNIRTRRHPTTGFPPMNAGTAHAESTISQLRSIQEERG